MRQLHLVSRRFVLFFALFAVLMTISGCFLMSKEYSYGKMKVRFYNDGDDVISNVRVTHDTAFEIFPTVEPGKKASTVFPLVADKTFTVEYTHPTTGVVTREYLFHARREDAGVIDIRVNRLGVVEVRTRAKLAK